MLKAEIDRAHSELKGMGNRQATMDFMIECAQEAWEMLAPELLNKLAEGMQKGVDAANGWYLQLPNPSRKRRDERVHGPVHIFRSRTHRSSLL